MHLRALLCTIWILATIVVAAFSKPVEAPTTRLVLDIEGRGRIVIKLHVDEAPKTTARIIELAQQKFYDGQRFFRVIRSPRPFLAQVGDPTSRTKAMNDATLGQTGTGKRIAYEDSGFKHGVGAVGMSRLPESKDTGDCQFYIMLGQASFLDGNYTVFGQVVSGMDLLSKLEVGDRVASARIERSN